MARSHLGVPDVRNVPVFIYGLTDPCGEIRYVGKSAQPRLRYRTHCRGEASRPVRRWINMLRISGTKPGLAILATVPKGHDADPYEVAFIQEYRKSGQLLNCVTWPCPQKTEKQGAA